VKQLAGFFATWIGCVLGLELVVFAFAFGQMDEYNSIVLARSWRLAKGVVSSIDRGNHDAISVRYISDGREFEQTFTTSERNAGDVLDVYYSPNNPRIAKLEEPEQALRKEISLLAAAGLMCGTFLAFSREYKDATRPRWPLSHFWLPPRLAMVLIATSELIEVPRQLYAAPSMRSWLAYGCVICGTALLCARAFRAPAGLSWIVFVRGRNFIAGVLLMATGLVAVWSY